MALAYFKARRVADQLRGITDKCAVWWGDLSRFARPGMVIGADTVCVAKGERILGQPRNAADARAMLLTLRNAEHRTITGVCLFPMMNGARVLFVDRAIVHVGRVTEKQIDRYVS